MSAWTDVGNATVGPVAAFASFVFVHLVAAPLVRRAHNRLLRVVPVGFRLDATAVLDVVALALAGALGACAGTGGSREWPSRRAARHACQ